MHTIRPTSAVPRAGTQWSLLMVLAAAIALCATVTWTRVTLNRSYHDAIRFAAVDALSDRVLLLDEATTSNATLAAVSGERVWIDQYDADARAYARAWPELLRALKTTDLAVPTRDAESATLGMARIEREAIALAAAGRRQEALALLHSDIYRAQKKTFAHTARQVGLRIHERVQLDRAAAERRGRFLLAAGLLFLPLFLLCWVLAFLSLRSYIRRRDAAERSLREREERFAVAARATKDVMYDWDLTSNVIQFNEALRTELRYDQYENVDASIWQNIHPDDAERILQAMHEHVESGQRGWTALYRFRRGDGTWADVLDRGYVLRDADGRALRMIGAMLDLTEQKQKETELRRVNAELERVSRKSELILDAAAEGIVGLDQDGRATFLNAAASEILGFAADDLCGRRFHDLMHHTRPDGAPRTYDDCEIERALRSGEATSVADDLFWRADGTSFAVEYSATPLRDEAGRISGAVITFRDTTERRAVQRMKDEFVSIVSHELRTPLTSIRGALGLLAGGLLTKAPQKGQRMLEIAVSNTDRLVRLINDILDIERIDSGTVVLSKSRCEPDALLQASVDVMRPLADKAGVALEIGRVDDAKIWADSDRIIQTLTNLLSNAIKFSPAGAAVSISAIYESDAVVFRVTDRGRGIPADKLESVFDRFQQVDASDSREKGGSGLGLTICRSIVRQHGGELRVESVLGEGSTFRFSLPGARIEAAPARSDATRILVCDDDDATRELLEALLRPHGYDVLSVSGGDELLERLPSYGPDLILLDIFMPQMSGWDTLARLKAEAATAAIPVVILSGLTRDAAETPFDLAGWVDKPLDPRVLFSALDHAVDAGDRRPQVLIVEDDFDLARVIAESLERHGIETLHAATGREAIDLTSRHTPDLLILDLVLPELDGFAVVEWLRDHEQLRNVPLVVYSAADPSRAERERLMLGATHFVTKSRVPPQEFERRVVALVDSMTKSRGAIANVA